VLDLCRTRSGGLSDLELAAALVFADLAGLLLLDEAAGTRPDSAEVTWRGDSGTGHQAIVHQATGMIIVQLGVPADAAFIRLRAYAWTHGRTLTEVARDVVDRRLRFAPDPTGPAP
jgi:hypothetical protein